MSAGMIAVPAIIPLKAPDKVSSQSRKWNIDPVTPIELHSKTGDCFLFYTLNGGKPDPFKTIGERDTYQYESAFTLPAGKHTVKAIAISADGSRQSSVNTKVFTVEGNEDDVGLNKTSWQKSADSNPRQSVSKLMFKKVAKQPELKSSHCAPKHSNMVSRVVTSSPVGFSSPDDSAEAEFIDVTICFQCGKARPKDPYVRFCKSCNSSFPPADGQLRSTEYTSPMNQCNVCNQIISPGAKCCTTNNESLRSKTASPQSNICHECGATNPTHSNTCLVCDTILKAVQGKEDNVSFSESSKHGVLCEECGKGNNNKALFCNWCGAEQAKNQTHKNCSRCSKENDFQALFCNACGFKFGSRSPKKVPDYEIDEGMLKREIHLNAVRKKRHTHTQTGDGVITAKDRFAQNSQKSTPGFWRQQIEYISQQLKIYAQNSLEFKETLSGYSFNGLLLAEVIPEESTASIVMKFDLNKKKSTAGKSSVKTSSSTIAGQTLMNALSTKGKGTGSRPSSAQVSSNSSTPRSRRNSGQNKKKKSQKSIGKEKAAAKLSKLSPETLKVLSVLNSAKETNEEKFENLVNIEGFDPDSCDENGIPLLEICVKNKKFRLLQTLIDSGVDLDQLSSTEDTALHRAVGMGLSALEAVEILLQNNASTDIPNKRAKTAYDLALDSGVDAVVNVFTKHTSQDLLKDITKF